MREDWNFRSATGAICVSLIAGILIATLWPFHRPANGVAWLGTHGIRFQKYGTLLSHGAVKPVSTGDAACSFEIRVKPQRTSSQTIFSVYTPEAPRKFALRQSNKDLVIRTQPGYGTPAFEVDDVFTPGKELHIAASSGSHGTTVFVNGAPMKTSADARFSLANLEGAWILSGLGDQHDAWQGDIQGFAVYNREFTAAEMSKHYENWSKTGRPDAGPSEHAVAVYDFDEGQGPIANNRAGHSQIVGADLFMPDKYVVLRHAILESPWSEFRPDWPYWEDVLINVAGFVPLGFFLRAYLDVAGKLAWPSFATILMGLATSVTVEILQSQLPTRDSSMTDVLTNTIGTCIGVWLCAAVYA